MMRRTIPLVVLLTPVWLGTGAAITAGQSVDSDVIATERSALERWGKGDPEGFLTTYADEISYFDPMRERRVDGRAALRELLAPLRGKLKVYRFEMLNPKVQHHGEIAVLTYNLVNYERLQDGTERPTTRWNSTAVFRRTASTWRTIHSHWSFTKPELKQ